MIMGRTVMHMFRCVSRVELFLSCISLVIGVYASVIVSVCSLSRFLTA